MSGFAWFSPCQRYRYTLVRTIDHGFLGAPHQAETVNFIMLNPSTATATLDDPTIRRCAGYARRWGYGTLVVTNLFAYRATAPADMLAAADPIGPENDAYISRAARGAALVVAAWGQHGAHRRRDEQVRRLVQAAGKDVHYLRLNANGQPAHPLYLPATLVPQPYVRPVAPAGVPA